ncbi:uncharacterized protein LOC142979837 [Anticarsia gemmatalis]|uniref:uncharacterized protein LOC142979837 n=1 Tax=Anticarsia gemmatalis TaxID=129554 RepID=UPI003F76CC12
MKFFIAIALFVAVASADFTKPTPVSQEEAQLQEIIAAIQNPSTNPATAAALEQMLQDLLGIKPEAVLDEESSVDIVDIVDNFPVFDSVAPAPAATPSSPLVQIIVNVNQAAAAAPSPVDPAPIDVPPRPFPIDIVDEVAPVDVEPVVIATPVIPAPAVNLPDPLN